MLIHPRFYKPFHSESISYFLKPNLHLHVLGNLTAFFTKCAFQSYVNRNDQIMTTVQQHVAFCKHRIEHWNIAYNQNINRLNLIKMWSMWWHFDIYLVQLILIPQNFFVMTGAYGRDIVKSAQIHIWIVYMQMLENDMLFNCYISVSLY